MFVLDSVTVLMSGATYNVAPPSLVTESLCGLTLLCRTTLLCHTTGRVNMSRHYVERVMSHHSIAQRLSHYFPPLYGVTLLCRTTG